MQNQRKLPSKRYSSYDPSKEISLEEHVGSSKHKLPPQNGAESLKMRNKSVPCGPGDVCASRRKSLNTLHFDALQSAVSRLSRIDDYDLEELGYGFFSDVFKVTHKQSGKVMVLKRNRTTNTKLNILKEIQLMNRLSHPNILKFMGVCVHEGQLHALTEFINGGDIDQLVQKNVFLSWLVRVRLAFDVSKGLQYLHSLGIFHRDLTAKNCLVRITTTAKQKKKYSAVLADLGLSEKIPINEEDKKKLKIVGTPYCMAPEVIRNKPYDERSDLFSLGLLVCQLIIRTSSDPDFLPRSNDFGLNRDLFNVMIKRGVGAPEMISGIPPVSMPPASFLQLAYDCCEVEPAERPNLSDIVKTLENTITLVKTERQLSKVKDHTKEPLKRHSVAHLGLPSITDFVKPSLLSPTIEESSNEEKKPHEMSYIPSRKRHSSNSNPRLSRSSSDVSKELIRQAASVMASSQLTDHDGMIRCDINDIVDSLSEAFINPFRNLEDTSLQERKLFDIPSLDVLEMAFDLPTPVQSCSGTSKHSHVSPVRLRKNRQTKPIRPKSLLVGEIGLELDPLTCLPISQDSSTDSDTFLKSPVSPLNSDSIGDVFLKRHVSDSQQDNLKHALIRSVIFSPQGNRLTSKWNHQPQKKNWKSISSLLSIFSTKVGFLKKSISVPDLSRFSDFAVKLPRKDVFQINVDSRSSSTSSDHELPKLQRIRLSTEQKDLVSYPSYITLPRKKRNPGRSSTTEVIRKRRIRTSDDSIQDPTLLETLSEESPEMITKTSSSDLALNPSTVTMPPHKTHTCTTSLQPCRTLDSTSSQNDCCCGKETQQTSSNQCSVQTGVEFCSSSNSSGDSSVGLQMSLQTGVISCTKRGRILSPHSETSRVASHEVEKEKHNNSPRPCNRDSGYNDDAFSVCDSNDSLSPKSTGHCPDSLQTVIQPSGHTAKVIHHSGCQNQSSIPLDLLMEESRI